MRKLLLLALIVIASGCTAAEKPTASPINDTPKDYVLAAGQINDLADQEQAISDAMCLFYDLDKRRSEGTALALADPGDQNYTQYIDILINTTDREMEVLRTVQEKIRLLQGDAAILRKINDTDVDTELATLRTEYPRYYASFLAGVDYWLQGLGGVRRNLALVRQNASNMAIVEDTQSEFKKGYDEFVAAQKDRTAVTRALLSLNSTLAANNAPLNIKDLHCLDPNSLS